MGDTEHRKAIRDIFGFRELTAHDNALFAKWLEEKVQLLPKLIKKYRLRAATETVTELRAHPDPIRYTLLAILATYSTLC